MNIRMGLGVCLLMALVDVCAAKTSLETIQILPRCDLSAYPQNAVMLFSPDSADLKGWSHVKSDASFSTLQQPLEFYQVNAAQIQPSASCSANSFQTVLVKKYADWNQNHSNGIEPLLGPAVLTFDQVKYIELQLNVHSERTFILSTQALLERYQRFLPSGYDEPWDNGEVTLEITLFSHQPEGASYAAGTLLTVAKSQRDKWLRIRLDPRELTLYKEQYYQRQQVTWSALKSLQISGLRINPESSTGKTLRHILRDKFSPADTPESFKEMGVEILTIALRQ